MITFVIYTSLLLMIVLLIWLLAIIKSHNKTSGTMNYNTMNSSCNTFLTVEEVPTSV